jgi:hypothetical protein
VIVEGRGVRLARDEKEKKENPGSHDRKLRSPKGYAARYVLRHRQLPIGKTRPPAAHNW